jgi:hypothetical protein
MLFLLNQCFAVVLFVSTTIATAGRPDVIVESFDVPVAPATMLTARCAAAVIPETARDKTGTNLLPRNEVGSLPAKNKPIARCFSFEAEDKGFEPSTGFPAPDFESESDFT